MKKKENSRKIHVQNSPKKASRFWAFDTAPAAGQKNRSMEYPRGDIHTPSAFRISYFRPRHRPLRAAAFGWRKQRGGKFGEPSPTHSPDQEMNGSRLLWHCNIVPCFSQNVKILARNFSFSGCVSRCSFLTISSGMLHASCTKPHVSASKKVFAPYSLLLFWTIYPNSETPARTSCVFCQIVNIQSPKHEQNPFPAKHPIHRKNSPFPFLSI